MLELVTDLATNRNIKEVSQFLEGEIRKAKKMQDSEKDKSAQLETTSTNEYRYLLIKSVNRITQIYPETIPAMLSPLMDSFLMFEKKGSMASLETIIFIREVIEVYPEHREMIVGKLCSLLGDIKNHLVLRVAIWIIGEYSIKTPEIDLAFESIKLNIGSLPIYPAVEEEKKDAVPEENKGPKYITKTIILPDGSYGTETILAEDASKQLNTEDQMPLRKSLKSAEDDFLASCIAISLTKLAVKCKKNLAIQKYNQLAMTSSLIICALLKNPRKQVDLNNTQRMHLCLKILTNPKLLKSVSGVQKILADQGKKIFQKFLEGNSRLIKEQREAEDKLIVT